jgi:hypothetical protein
VVQRCSRSFDVRNISSKDWRSNDDGMSDRRAPLAGAEMLVCRSTNSPRRRTAEYVPAAPTSTVNAPLASVVTAGDRPTWIETPPTGAPSKTLTAWPWTVPAEPPLLPGSTGDLVQPAITRSDDRIRIRTPAGRCKRHSRRKSLSGQAVSTAALTKRAVASRFWQFSAAWRSAV